MFDGEIGEKKFPFEKKKKILDLENFWSKTESKTRFKTRSKTKLDLGNLRQICLGP